MKPRKPIFWSEYECLLADVVHVIDEAQRATARVVNAAMNDHVLAHSGARSPNTSNWVRTRAPRRNQPSRPREMASYVSRGIHVQIHGGQKCGKWALLRDGFRRAPK